jgi:glycosyltransferase involved in cell wall biosynthesis
MKISVVVPARNEEHAIAALLDGLVGQTRPPDEIVICDNGSTDRTADIVEAYAERGLPVRLLREGPGLPGRGRNVGSARASHDWLAYIDAGTRPAPDWLEILAARAGEDAGAAVVYGEWEPVTDTLFKECAAIAYVPPPEETEGGWVRPRSIVSCLMRRGAWEAAGGFPEHLRSAEDLLFMNEVERLGFRAVRAPRALVRWDIQPDLWRTFKRFVVYSRNNVRAGLFREWQAAIFRRYALLAALALPALLVGVWWLAVVLALWLLMLVARAAAALRRQRRAYPAPPARQLLRLLVLVPVIAALDAAAVCGATAWLFLDRLGAGARAEGVRHGA